MKNNKEERLDFARITREVEKRNKLIFKIVEKFGSVRAFANHSENPLQPWTVIRTLNGTKKKDVPKLLKRIEYFCNKIKFDERKITKKHRDKIRKVILLKVGSAAKFSRQNPTFSRPYISTVLNGKKIFFDDKTRDFYELICKLDANQKSKP